MIESNKVEIICMLWLYKLPGLLGIIDESITVEAIVSGYATVNCNNIELNFFNIFRIVSKQFLKVNTEVDLFLSVMNPVDKKFNRT